MNNLNSILIEGNLVRDPDLRLNLKGTPLCTFTLASNHFFKQDSGIKKETSFFDVEAWGKLAESVGGLGRKGRGVRVVGRLKQERWTGTDGKPRSKISIVADHVEFRPEFHNRAEEDPDPGLEELDSNSGELFPEKPEKVVFYLSVINRYWRMLKMYENDIRGFHRSDKAWYADINDIHLPEITFGVYSDCGGCMAELTVKWGKLYGEDLVPQLQVFNDAWRMLSEMKDLIDELAKYDKQNISADKFCEILLSLGFKDLTEYKRPEESDAKAKKINEREAKTQTKEL